MQKIRVGILGATGIVGQTYLTHLMNHPYFEVQFLAASANSSNLPYKEALRRKNQPLIEELLPFADFPVYDAKEVDLASNECELIFSALDAKAAQVLEPLYASRGFPVLSNASAYRMESDVPVLIPEINPSHLEIIEVQQKQRGWPGYILTKSNCSIMSFLIPLYPLHLKFGLKKVAVTTLQAISGAGYPGLSGMDILNNVIPYIPQEEIKSQTESLKILGRVENSEIWPLSNIEVSVSCNRVPVLHGHMACVHVEFEEKPSEKEILKIWREFEGLPQKLDLPSAPKRPIHYLEEMCRPQPKLDLNGEQQMAVSVGRLRPCQAFHYKFTGLSHNLLRGAALGGILNAELLYRLGYFHSQSPTFSQLLHIEGIQ